MAASQDPADPFAECVLHRMGDLAAYMLQRGMRVHVTQGTTANGHPCSVIVAIGDQSETLADIGRRVALQLATERLRIVRKSEQN